MFQKLYFWGSQARGVSKFGVFQNSYSDRCSGLVRAVSKIIVLGKSGEGCFKNCVIYCSGERCFKNCVLKEVKYVVHSKSMLC